MRRSARSILVVGFAVAASFLRSQAATADSSAKPDAAPSSLTLDSLQGLDVEAVPEAGVEPTKFKADVVTYRGRRAVHILNNDRSMTTGDQTLAIVKGSDFQNGVIEVELVGMPREGAPDDCRGFIGIAFRVQDHGARFEAFYLRFTNGRADEQIRRNHSTQYVSQPDYPWHRLRKENPGVYESYVDIEERAWTKLKIVVSGTKAQLYVNDAAQPCLIVNDLKLGDSRGQVALWTGSDTEAYFSQLKIQ
jgi:hypothetical protein